ncbi:MAG: hypothetical protein ABEI86_06440, partial [Halobacteriaceae archaeon]
FGDHTLEFPDGTTSLQSVIQPVGEHEFESIEGVLETIHYMVGNEAVGEVGRTGRGTSDITPPPDQRPPGQPQTEENEDVSF